MATLTQPAGAASVRRTALDLSLGAWHKDICAWTAALAVSGYPLAGLISTYLGVESDLISVFYRALTAALAIVVIWATARKVGLISVDKLLALLWFMYTLRLLWDTMDDGAPPEIGTIWVVFLLSTTLPTFGLALSARSWNSNNVAKALFVINVLVSIGGLWMTFVNPVADAALLETINQLSYKKVNQITLGHAGCTAVLASVALLGESKSKITRSILVAGAALGLTLIYFAASRGPVVALILSLSVYFFLLRRSPHPLTFLGLWLLGVVVVATVDIDALVTHLYEQLRFGGTGVDASSVERLQLIGMAIDEFEAHPLIGSRAFLPTCFGCYPHNIIVEAMMALGVAGLAALLGVIIRAALTLPFAAVRSDAMAGMLFVQFLVAGQFSGTIWGWPGLWIGMALLLARSRLQRSAALRSLRNVPMA